MVGVYLGLGCLWASFDCWMTLDVEESVSVKAICATLGIVLWPYFLLNNVIMNLRSMFNV